MPIMAPTFLVARLKKEGGLRIWSALASSLAIGLI
jgi:hypothetical protein